MTHKRLSCIIAFHAWLYYEMAEPKISDIEYDKMYRELEDMEAKDKSLVTRFSPTQNVDVAIASRHWRICPRCSWKKFMWLKDEL